MIWFAEIVFEIMRYVSISIQNDNHNNDNI